MLLTDSEIGYFRQLAGGAVITMELAVSGYLLALASGTVVGLLTLSRNRLIQAVWRVYASIIMGVPSLLVIFLFYYGGSSMLEGVIDITPFAAGLSALVVVYTVYVAELVRGAIRNVPRGQFEASAALAIRPMSAWWHVIMPQAVRLALAGLITVWMVVLKDTALVSLAGLNDLVAHAKTAAGASKEPFIFFVTAALFFVVFSAATLRVSARLERRFGRGLAVVKA
ncbi:MAG TPA: ABC transporter permease subunit [Acetobacteraceae bacterium]|nr:ABC transporter permease subunit [Acetobacteraceae bacterium]